MYQYVLVCTSMYWYVPVCTGMYWYVLISVDTGFCGSHRDAAMQPPSADHASMEDRDPHPCPEDEEFFECRPDAADMEEAIGKFMEGSPVWVVSQWRKLQSGKVLGTRNKSSVQ